MKVKCNQTGHVYVTGLDHLVDDQIHPVQKEDLFAGSQVLWEVDESAYPVTVVEVLGGNKIVCFNRVTFMSLELVWF